MSNNTEKVTCLVRQIISLHLKTFPKPEIPYNLSSIKPDKKTYHIISGYLIILLKILGKKPNVKVFNYINLS